MADNMAERWTWLSCSVMLDLHLEVSEFNPQTDCGGSAQKLNAIIPIKNKA